MGSADSDEQAFDDEKPQHTVDIPYDYWLARFPITNAQYAQYIQAEGKDHPVRDWQKKKDHPVTGVSWENAMIYCQWLNHLLKGQLPPNCALRLPTEAEWEKAARWKPSVEGRGQGGVLSLSKDKGEALLYPWGNIFDETRCNTSEGMIGGTMPVGKYSPQGDSPYGCANMSGNVLEWTHSLFKPYPYQAGDGREFEHASDRRVLRGGSWASDDRVARCTVRVDDPIDFLLDYKGFRVAASPVLL